MYDDELEGLIKTVKVVSDDSVMEFGLDKCAKASFKRGKILKTYNIIIDNKNILKELEHKETYKYLGVNEGNGIEHGKMKEKIRKECVRRVKLILNTELKSKKNNCN